MSPLVRRRMRFGLSTLVSALVAARGVEWIDVQLGRSVYWSGPLLYVVLLGLALFQLRKKLWMLSLGSAALWLQCHIYLGLFSGILFGLHVGWKWPQGPLETLLGLLFLLTLASGVVGLYLSRALARILSRAGREVIYERIPRLRRLLFQQSQQAVVEPVGASGSQELARFYAARLLNFFAKPRSLWYRLRPSSRYRRQTLHALRDIQRYLTTEEQQASETLFRLVREKDDLDFHEARQWLLKVWLFVHLGLTYLLILLATLHGVVVYSFRGTPF